MAYSEKGISDILVHFWFRLHRAIGNMLQFYVQIRSGQLRSVPFQKYILSLLQWWISVECHLNRHVTYAIQKKHSHMKDQNSPETFFFMFLHYTNNVICDKTIILSSNSPYSKSRIIPLNVSLKIYKLDSYRMFML